MSHSKLPEDRAHGTPPALCYNLGDTNNEDALPFICDNLASALRMVAEAELRVLDTPDNNEGHTALTPGAPGVPAAPGAPAATVIADTEKDRFAIPGLSSSISAPFEVEDIKFMSSRSTDVQSPSLLLRTKAL